MCIISYLVGDKNDIQLIFNDYELYDTNREHNLWDSGRGYFLLLSSINRRQQFYCHLA